MGWSFSMNRSEDRAALIQRFRRPGGLLGTGYTMLQSSAVGNNFWYLYRCPDGRVTIGLSLMAGGGHQGMGWGHKDISEDMGPSEVNCPISYLSKADPAPLDSYASNWREKVRAHHAARKERQKWAAGVVVAYGGNRYTLKEVNWRGARHGWDVIGDDGFNYRMRAGQLSKAKVVKV